MPSELSLIYKSKQQAQLSDVRRALGATQKVLQKAKLQSLTISSAEIALAEVLNNIVKHAIANTANGWFSVECTISQSRIQFHVCDNGTRMPNNVLPKGMRPDVDHSFNNLPEGGWGWSLIRTLADQLTYVRINNINHVTFQISAFDST